MAIPPRAAAALSLAVPLVLLVGNTTERADVVHNYRPALPAATLENGCYPLPTGVRLGFAHQVRSDADVPAADGGVRRRLVLQYDEVDARVVARRLADSFGRAGFTRTADLQWRRADVGRVAATVRDLPGVESGSLVRGTVVLDLPSAPAASTDAVCAQTSSTKRFEADS